MSQPAPPPSSDRLSGLARLVVLTTVVALAVVALGGVVRATDNGLACPTWPGCFSGGDFVPRADVGVWLEHGHRLLAGGLGLLIAAALLWALLRHRDRRTIVWSLAGAAFAVVVQALLGAAVVLFQLRAELVTAHLGMGMAVVALLLLVAVEATRGPVPSPAGDRRLTRTSLGVAALTYVQILVGGHVTGLGAGLVYEGSPLLGIATFAPIARESQLFNAAHRVLAVALVIAIGVLVSRTVRSGATGWLARLAHVASGLVLLQVLLGVANLWSGLSPLSVIPHLAVASWLWAVLVLHAALSARRVTAGPDAATSDTGARELAGSAR